MLEKSVIISYMPILFIPFLIAAKIFLGKKFNNIIFTILLFMLLILSAITIIVVAIMLNPVSDTLVIPLSHRINTILGETSIIYFGLYYKLFLLLYPLFLGVFIFTFLKSKSMEICKKFALSTFFLLILLVFSIPTMIYDEITIFPVKNEKYQTNYELNIEKNTKALTLSFLPVMKVTYYKFLSMNYQNHIFERFAKEVKIPNYSSEEAKKLIDEYIAYAEKYAQMSDYNGYLVLAASCLNYERFDEALKYAELAKKYGAEANRITAAIYIAIGEYKKALEFLDKDTKAWADKKKFAVCYISLGNYDKVADLIEEEEQKTDYLWKPQVKIYLSYKMGNKSLAKELYNEYKEQHDKFTNYTFEEFIKYIDRIDY